ncbi:Esterase TesA [Aquicella lusitana]|uniref:Acyl-CoA thioesterase-1 n=2 Tax=Aquicella lusitana TaxID=254246 RepID=A0A370GRE4_9COXI|nr:acyl-CoA thioesterase-1 [Aquicella lusitana]VVC72535.1 Esterase TesA [Aquicella lusitana]
MAENTILVIGDSLSAAYGIEPKQGWVALLQEKLTKEKFDYRVINASVSGDTTSNGLARLPAALKKYQPDITIIQLGANDGLRGLDTAVIKKNLEQMIALAKKEKSKVLVLGIRLPTNYGPQYTTQFEQIFTGLAKRKDIHVVSLLLKGIDENIIHFQADGLHPTAAAQPIIVANVWFQLSGLLRKNNN